MSTRDTTKRHWAKFRRIYLNYVSLIVLVTIAILVQRYFTRLYINNPEQFFQQLPILIGVIAVIIAGISVRFGFRSVKHAERSLNFARQSLDITNESLELTRSMVRPFVALQPGPQNWTCSKSTCSMIFRVQNTGSIPGKLRNTKIDFFDVDEVITENNKSEKYTVSLEQKRHSIAFPNDTILIIYYLDLKREDIKNLWQMIINGRIMLRHRIIYEGLEKEYMTIQTASLSQHPDGPILLTPGPLQKWT